MEIVHNSSFFKLIGFENKKSFVVLFSKLQ